MAINPEDITNDHASEQIPNNQSKQEFLRKTSPVDIEFDDINYSVRHGRNKSACTHILKSLNGQFYAGELTAILGPSGSGKSTLLNILAGYVLDGVTGSIKINDKPRQMHLFNKLSAYIMEEDLLPSLLTVEELVTVAAKLKLGDDVILPQKLLIVREVISSLGLDGCQNTRTENISGGERKRLTIALELVNNPPVIFLDEPTTGLDTFAVKQCIETLRLLTKQGRTIICTIHQPSNSIFQQFDQIYFIANGMCVYNGSTSNIVPFLSSIDLPCPITYSPAEYVIELVQQDEHISVMTSATQNGKVNRRERSVFEVVKTHSIYEALHDNIEETMIDKKIAIDFPTSFWTQFCIIFSRKMLQLRRNKLIIAVQVFNHTFAGIGLGATFFGIGNNAAMSVANYKFCVSIITFFLYTYLMVPVLLFPTEIKILKREYFNRWYSLKAYYLAVTLENLPLLTSLGILFLLITYLMTGQPLELNRFLMLVLPSILFAIATESLGLAVGSIFNIKNGSIIAPAIGLYLLMMGIYGIGFGYAIHPFMKIMMHMSYMRYAAVAFALAIFDNRPSFECSDEDLICYYKEPKDLLRDIGMLDLSYSVHIIGLVLFTLFSRLITFFVLRHRMASEFSRRKVLKTA